MVQRQYQLSRGPGICTCSCSTRLVHSKVIIFVIQQVRLSFQPSAHSLDRLASAGHEGRNPKNMQRALMSAFGWPRGATDFTWDEIPVAGYERPQPHPFLCPHATFAAIYKNRPDLWHEAILGEKNSNVEFWKQCAHDPDIPSHPKLQSAADRKKNPSWHAWRRRGIFQTGFAADDFLEQFAGVWHNHAQKVCVYYDSEVPTSARWIHFERDLESFLLEHEQFAHGRDGCN